MMNVAIVTRLHMIILAESGTEQFKSGLLDSVSGGANSFIEDILNTGTNLLNEFGNVTANAVNGVTNVVDDTLGGLGKVLGGN